MSSLAATKTSPRKRNAASERELEPERITIDRGSLEPETITDVSDPAGQEPLTADRNDRIREAAYFLWVEEGYPDRQSERHWLAAEILLDSDPVERKLI
jgi:hypothetical protein